jgi:DNA-binding transcriptional LysR family regulator
MQLLETFLAVVDERHFGRAAEICFLSAPTVGKHVARLEAQVGRRLLDREPTGQLILTADGARLAEGARALLDHERALRRIASGRAAAVVLGYPAPGDGQPIPAVLGYARRLIHLRHPDMTLVWRRTPLPLLTRWVLEGTVDVQMYAGPVEHSRLRSTLLGPVPRLAAVGSRDPLSGADKVGVNDLAERPMLYDPDVPTDFMSLFWLGDLRSRREARLVSVVARDSRAVLEHIVRGAGVTIVLPVHKDRVPAGVHVLPLHGAEPLAVHAVTRRDDRRSEVALAVDVLAELFADWGRGSPDTPATGRRTG